MIGSDCFSVVSTNDKHFLEIEELLKYPLLKYSKYKFDKEKGLKNQSTEFYIKILTIISKAYCEEKGLIKKNSWDIVERCDQTIELMEQFENNKGYQLNVDNFIKIALILQKARNGMSINIMGETGCGKTYLIKFVIEVILRDVSCFEDTRELEQEKNDKDEILFSSIKTMHFGVTYYEFIKFLLFGFAKAYMFKNEKVVWLFFDEFNTSEYQSFINEMMSDNNISIKYDFIHFKEMFGISNLPEYVEKYLTSLTSELNDTSNLIQSNSFISFYN